MNDRRLGGFEFRQRGGRGVIVVSSGAVSESRGDDPTHGDDPRDAVAVEWRCLAPHSP